MSFFSSDMITYQDLVLVIKNASNRLESYPEQPLSLAPKETQVVKDVFLAPACLNLSLAVETSRHHVEKINSGKTGQRKEQVLARLLASLAMHVESHRVEKPSFRERRQLP